MLLRFLGVIYYPTEFGGAGGIVTTMILAPFLAAALFGIAAAWLCYGAYWLIKRIGKKD
jgi:hypothetical protein